MTDASSSPSQTLSQLIRTRRSVRDFLPQAIPETLLTQVLEDAQWSPSWSNTQPYRIAIASGEVRAQLSDELGTLFDRGMAAQSGGWLGKLKLLLTRQGLPDGDFSTQFPYPEDLQAQRRATGAGLYEVLGIGRKDVAARNQQMRRNFEFFGAPTALFLFAHKGLREFSILDTGIFLNALMLSAHAHGLATCAQGALATWASPIRARFDVPAPYQLICGVSIGYASDAAVNQFNPGRSDAKALQIDRKQC
jgi:nitroreductase